MKKVVGRKLTNYPEKTYSHAAAAVDVALFRIKDNSLQIVLLELEEEPLAGLYALPGGLVTYKEGLKKAANRHLKNKIGLNEEIYLEQLYSFGDPDRDPLGWVVAVAYLGLTNKHNLKLKAAERYGGVKWFNVKSLPKLAYDHKDIINTSIERLTIKIGYTNIIKYLVSNEFTLTELQTSYEILLGKELDKRNFRKKILSLGIIKPLKKLRHDGAQRPAQLYSFKNKDLIEASML